MDTQTDSARSIAGDENLVFDFFVTFSRFECALKRSTFIKPDRHKNAMADWDEFADSLNGEFAGVLDADFISAKSFLLSEPPRKQMFVAPHSIRWGENPRRPGESDARYLLRLVRDVRNNLFHGGKYPVSQGGPINGESLRNRKLLQACLTILDKCRSLNADIEFRFS